TPEAVLQLLQQRGVALAGSHALVIGRSRIVGSPLAAALLAADATVSVAHSRTKGLASLCRSADVIVSCAGYPGLVRGAWVKDGAAVVSVG
ncbi:tetrahydrofolate dehydrogenase/cyclohydrolase, partial [Emiliania huxleyi CCMP1516]|uniref:methenyltetrahydrofolate cyclohydrolase n=2 Tax=Emiliania huxleyi TaxID=2903 RepID=A0A0D3KR47_EMIH1